MNTAKELIDAQLAGVDEAAARGFSSDELAFTEVVDDAMITYSKTKVVYDTFADAQRSVESGYRLSLLNKAITSSLRILNMAKQQVMAASKLDLKIKSQIQAPPRPTFKR